MIKTQWTSGRHGIYLYYYDERKRARNQFGRRHSTASGSGQNGARQRVYNNNIIQYIRRIRRLFSLSPSHALRRRRESVIRNHKNPIHNAAAAVVSVFITLRSIFLYMRTPRIRIY